MKEKSKINAENPEGLTGLKLKKPATKAAGIKAVTVAIKHMNDETGLSRGMKALKVLNQEKGIDCPGCAWPDPDDERSKLGEYCENGVKAIAEEATKKVLRPDFFESNSVSELSMLTDFQIGKKGRIAQPMYLGVGKDHYVPIEWDEAFRKIASQLNQLEHPDEAIFYTSGRTSNEAAFLYQLFVRELGTNNLPDCSNMCHESSGKALSETVGIGKGSVKLEDFYEAEVILVIGQNPGTNHPRMLSALEKAKQNGAIVISVNPIVEAGLVSFAHPQKPLSFLGSATQISDIYLQVKINSDLALFQYINSSLIEKQNQLQQVLDESFIHDKTTGYEVYKKHLESLDKNKLLEYTGISRDTLDQVVDVLGKKSKIIACWAMGITQHKNAVNTIKEVVNLLLLKGSIAKPGAGTCPVRGHSNVQGDRTMGIHEAPSSKLLDSIQAHFNFDPPRKHGFDTVESIKAMYEGKAKIFFGMGGNFLSATPDTLYTAKALEKCDLTVHVSTKLNRSHLVHGREAIILPCLARTDVDTLKGQTQFVSVENSMGVVHSSQGQLKPVSNHLLSEVNIVTKLALATFKNSSIHWSKYQEHYDHIREDIEQVIPGFEDYNSRVRDPKGFYLPNVARDGRFKSDGKAAFNVSSYSPIPLAKDEFLMMTVRSHDQFNTTIYGLDDRYRGIYSERRVVMINPKDIEALGLNPGDRVDLINEFGGKNRIAKNFILVPYNIPRNCVATYFPEANVLVPISSVADKSNTPASKSVVIKFKRKS